jgi:hypothetical protein
MANNFMSNNGNISTNSNNKFINNIQLYIEDCATGERKVLQCSLMVPAYNTHTEAFLSACIDNPDVVRLGVQYKEKASEDNATFAAIIAAADAKAQQDKANAVLAQQTTVAPYAPQNVQQVQQAPVANQQARGYQWNFNKDALPKA